MSLYKLDNPVWYALSEKHHPFAIQYPNTKFYQPQYSLFGATNHNDANLLPDILQHASRTPYFFIVNKNPSLPQQGFLIQPLICLQMIIEKNIPLTLTNPIITLHKKHFPHLTSLVNLVQPGYFQPQTPSLGTYYAILNTQNIPIATIGTRIQLHHFTEISSIITHPLHTQKGYASQLIAHLVNLLLNNNQTPFLHVLQTNTSAIRLYQKLGFHTRTTIPFYKITPLNSPS